MGDLRQRVVLDGHARDLDCAGVPAVAALDADLDVVIVEDVLDVVGIAIRFRAGVIPLPGHGEIDNVILVDLELVTERVVGGVRGGGGCEAQAREDHEDGGDECGQAAQGGWRFHGSQPTGDRGRRRVLGRLSARRGVCSVGMPPRP